MKTWHWLIALAVTALVCLFIGRSTRKVQTVTVTAPETTWTRIFIHDTTVVAIHDTVISEKYDTLIITQYTPIGEIPLRVIASQDSFPVDVNGKRHYLPFDLAITYRGLVYRYNVSTHPKPYQLSLKKPVVDFYGTMSAIYLTDKTIKGDLETGVMFWDRVALLARVEVDSDKRANFGAGVKVRIF